MTYRIKLCDSYVDMSGLPYVLVLDRFGSGIRVWCDRWVPVSACFYGLYKDDVRFMFDGVPKDDSLIPLVKLPVVDVSDSDEVDDIPLDVDDLTTITGIGKKTAKDILKHVIHVSDLFDKEQELRNLFRDDVIDKILEHFA